MLSGKNVMINATNLETMTPLVWYINQKPDFIEFDKKNRKGYRFFTKANFNENMYM